MCVLICFSACTDDDASNNAPPNVIGPQLLNLSFYQKKNPEKLVDDVIGQIIGDSVVDCWIPNLVFDKHLMVDIEGLGGVKINGDPYNEFVAYDFGKPAIVEIHATNRLKTYKVYVHSYTGLPVLWIDTDGRQEIVSKEEYLKAHLKLVENAKTRGAGDILERDVNIKGRGNSTWRYEDLKKKPYRLKFDEKVSMLDEPKDKSWCLLANYADKTMLRNHIGLFMGKISKLDYTPSDHFVELFLNGRYNGTYQLTDKIKQAKNRVNVGDDGFLLEIDHIAWSESDSRWFRTKHLQCPVNIKDPDVEYDDDNYNYIKSFVINAEEVLYSSQFTDPNEGWQKYFDIDSFVDWYIINEIAKNSDARMRTSCFINLKRGGKLKMGPVWDFDVAFGNVYDEGKDTWNYENFWINDAEWFEQMFKDPLFVKKVKERFSYFYNQSNEIMNEINSTANYLRFAVQENNNKWNTFYNYTWINNQIWGSYFNEVTSLKEWILFRMEWLKVEFDKM